jgi:Fic family protein
MPDYVHRRPTWPTFTWDQNRLVTQLAAVRHRQGRLIGRMQSLGLAPRAEAVLRTLTEDVLKTSEIEGEILDKEEVRSSIARRLGMEAAGLPSADRDVEGVVEMMLDATPKFGDRLTGERLLAWHASLFPTGRSGMRKILAGSWRDDRSGPMQVVSGAEGRERIHDEAPAASRLDAEMNAFLDWFNGEDDIDPVLKAALAHLWFVTIHPFDDGNGRIARAIADMSLARSEESSQRFYSMSAQIRLERKAYYDMLEATQKGDLEITPWMQWFLGCLDRAFEGAETTLSGVFRKAEFWRTHPPVSLNERQRDMLNRLLDGFEGKLTSSKWASIEKCSPDTALRDIADLVGRGLIMKNEGGGRSTSYSLGEGPSE